MQFKCCRKVNYYKYLRMFCKLHKVISGLAFWRWAMLAVVTTVEKGCGCCVSAQVGQRAVLAWWGGGRLQQKWGTPRKTTVLAQVSGVTSEEDGSCRPGCNEIISTSSKTSTPLGIPPFPDLPVQSCCSCWTPEVLFFLSSPQGKCLSKPREKT